MSALTFTAGAAPAGRGQLALMARMALLVLVPIWVFSGGFVLIEPGPYEALFVIAVALMLIAGVELNPRTRNLVVAMILFLPAALIAAAQVRFNPVSEAVLYSTVTLFLLLTSFVSANYIAEAPFSRVRLFNSAYIAAAVIVSAIGVLAYLGFLPGEDVFLKFGRAKATFKDPNVFGPFLLYPAAVLLQRILLGNGRQIAASAAPMLILFVGLFVSFSRGAWGHFAMTAGIEFLLVFFLVASGRRRARLVVLAGLGTAALALVVAGLLSFEPIRSLFEIRAEVVQDYDTGAFGRFGRQAYAAIMALNNPLGQGPEEFGHYRIGEDPHNTYLKVFLAYGWVGGAALIWLIAVTVWRGVKSLALPSPNRLALIPVVATFIPMAIEAAIIDVDHWRHFFLLIGLIWGITAAYDRMPAPRERAALP
ncbi:MAG: O-antigen ligase family protein [Cucumibacter sp.]